MHKRLWVVLIAMLLLAACAVGVCAAEETDWSEEDWDTWTPGDFNNLLFKEQERYASLQKWLKEEASFPELFEYGRHTDGAGADDFFSIAHGRFLETPEAFLIALSQEDAQTQQNNIRGIVYSTWPGNRDETIRVLESATISREENPEAVALLAQLIDKVESALKEQRIGVTIVNPQTGDGVMTAVAGLLLSGALLMLFSRPRRIRSKDNEI